MKNLLLFILLLVSPAFFAQKQAGVSIQTNAQCGDCKERIETELNQTKGVIYAELNLETKVVEIKFRPSKVNPEALHKVITSIGYNADDQKADPRAQKALPLCCQPGGH